MKFYYLNLTEEIEEIGHYPQTERTKRKGYHVEAFNSERKVDPKVFPEFNPKYGLDLNQKSKETDFLDRATLDFGFVISEKIKDILAEFILPPHRFYPIDVFDSNYQYYWFHFISEMEKYIDFKNTEMEIFDVLEQKVLETKTLNSYDQFLSLNKELVLKVGKTLRYKKVVLKSSFPKYDLFEINGAQSLTLISENLKGSFEEKKVTGIEFLEYDKLNVLT